MLGSKNTYLVASAVCLKVSEKFYLSLVRKKKKVMTIKMKTVRTQGFPNYSKKIVEHKIYCT